MASPQLTAYLASLGLTPDQVQSILAAVAPGQDHEVQDHDVIAAALRFLAAHGGQPPQGPNAGGTTGGAGGGAGNGTPGGTIPGATPGAPFDPSQLPVSPLASNPAATVAEVSGYQQQVAGGLLSGAYTPYQVAASGRGQDPNNRPGPTDASPEANLPGMAYAGTVDASVLSPEQAASVQYNTPEFQAWLASQVAGGRGDSIGITRATLQNDLTAGMYAGSAPDLNAAIQTARQADYAQWIARLRASGADVSGLTQADYERGMGLQPVAAGATTAARGTGATNNAGHATSMVPVSAPTPDYTSQVNASFANANMPSATAVSTAPPPGMTTPSHIRTMPPGVPRTAIAPGTRITGDPRRAPLTPRAPVTTAPAAPPAAKPAPGATTPARAPLPPRTPTVTAPTTAQLLATNQQYVANLTAASQKAPLTAAQKASLAAAQAKVARYS